MRLSAFAPFLLLPFLAAAAAASDTSAQKPRKPKLDLRASPPVSFAPVNIFVTAELVGGDEHEDYYCPSLEWDWGDGTKSERETECQPFEPGVPFERRFTAQHVYRAPGTYSVRVILRRASRKIAATSTHVLVNSAGLPR
jgi:hypothetical protein